MKVFKKDHLPDEIKYRGNTYRRDSYLQTGIEATQTEYSRLQEKLKKDGFKMVLVECQHPRLKGKENLHGEPYKPSVFIYSTRAR